MAIDMKSTSYERNNDEAAIKKAVSDLTNGICSYLTGARYNNVITVVKNNWVGPDADAFVASFQKKIATMRTELPKKYTERFYVAIKNNIADFNAQQQKNANTNSKF